MANKNVIWCDQTTLSKDLGGKTYIVTGSNSGVGFETAQQLVRQGVNVLMACRRPEAGEKARKNFKDLSGGGFLMSTLFSILKPIFKALNFSDSSWESAQASLHCLLSDDAPDHSGAYFSQHSILYRDKKCRKGGFTMETPNPNAKDMNTARKLVQQSRELVRLN